jgi:CheY-like chemotaxis protein
VVLRQLRNDVRASRLCVVVFTSSNAPADITHRYALGCSSHAIKPVTYEDYIEAVRGIADFWLALNGQRRSLAQALRPSFTPIM